jgi:hypothetical protein
MLEPNLQCYFCSTADTIFRIFERPHKTLQTLWRPPVEDHQHASQRGAEIMAATM